MVEVDEDRLKVLASGARCVSFSSAMVRRVNMKGQHRLRTLGELPRHGCGLSGVRFEK
jgi:isopentenyl diphosphate isomerase/L-lactate dehydrogenase-like FMN-dependent dehydrogenase